MTPTKPRVPPLAGLLFGILAVSTASTLIRSAQAAGVPSLAIAAWRLTLASVLLAPAVLFPRRTVRSEWHALSPREWGLLLVSGVFLALHFYTWIASLEMTSVAASVVLVSTHPLFVAVLSYVLLREVPGRGMLLGMPVALVGLVVITLGDAGNGAHRLAGDGLALLGALAITGHMLLGRHLRAKLSLLAYVFPVYAVAALTLLGLAVLSGVSLWGYAPSAWLLLLLIALIPQILGHSSFNWALGHIPATYVALAGLGEPLGSTLLAWAILHEAPPQASVTGGLLILIGLGVAGWSPADASKESS